MIKVNNLSKRFGPIAAIDGVSFGVEKGEILGFLGPNAAGKTTTMRILTCFFPPSSGSATVAGFDVFENSRDVRRRIGYLPENPPLYPDMTVEAYLKFVAHIKEVPLRDVKNRIEEIIERVHIEPVRTQKIAKISKGFKQRVGLAQAMIHNPEVLILDEPTVGLDPKQIIEVRELIRSLSGQHTIILSTHILPEVSMTCDRVVIINKGKVVAEDTTKNLSTRLEGSERFQIHLEGPREDVATRLKAVAGVKSIAWMEQIGENDHRFQIETDEQQVVRDRIARTIIENGWKLYELRLSTLSLEDVFLQLTTEEEIDV